MQYLHVPYRIPDAAFLSVKQRQLLKIATSSFRNKQNESCTSKNIFAEFAIYKKNQPDMYSTSFPFLLHDGIYLCIAAGTMGLKIYFKANKQYSKIIEHRLELSIYHVQNISGPLFARTSPLFKNMRIYVYENIPAKEMCGLKKQAKRESLQV